MANRQKGEVSIDVDGTTYTLALTVDAMVALEEMFSTPAKSVTFQDVITESDKGSIKHLRGLLWSLLQLHHPELGIKDISPLVQRAGGLGVFAAKFMELAKSAFADPADLEALGVKAGTNPPQAQAGKKIRGIGERSTSARAAQA
jgi:hypothetical protein